MQPNLTHTRSTKYPGRPSITPPARSIDFGSGEENGRGEPTFDEGLPRHAADRSHATLIRGVLVKPASGHHTCTPHAVSCAHLAFDRDPADAIVPAVIKLANFVVGS
jgi:hypothetical protein